MKETTPWQNPDSDKGMQKRFATTSWSLIVDAGGSQSAKSRAALEQLCQQYWFPLYAFVRRKGYERNDAEEMTQGFFAHLLDQDRLQLADQTKGRFRSFLLRSIENFIIQEWRKQTAIKRGGNFKKLGLDFDDAERRYSLEPVDEFTPERLFERKWAIEVLQQVMLRLEQHYSSRDKSELFNRLRPHLVKEQSGTYQEIAADLAMNEIAIKVAAHRMRQKYRELLCELISETLGEDTDVEQEISDLFQSLAS